MPRDVTITFDAANPFLLADFWAVALEYERVEPPKGYDTWESFGDIVPIRDPEQSRPELLFIKVPESKTAKNRVHLDVKAGEHVRGGKSDEYLAMMRAVADELVAAGATEVGPCSDFGVKWIVMADPEGNEFCVV